MNTSKQDLRPRNHEVVILDFFGPGKNLELWQLGWQPENRREAKSSVSQKIFDFYVEECHFNIIFYYVKDGNFYGIHSEDCPTPIFRFKKETAQYPIYKIENQDTHDYNSGEILYMIPCNQKIWDVVRIDGKSLEEVLQDSYIVNIS